MNFEWASILILASLPAHAFEKQIWLKNILAALGYFLFFVGLFVRVWARGYNKNNRFVLDGPYRYVQNPDELASFLLYVGSYLALGVIWSWTLAFAFLVLTYFTCVSGSYEEKLKKKVGTNFPRYRLRVTRWWPSFYPAVNRSRVNFEWKKALGREYSTWLWLLGMAAVVYLRQSEILPRP